MLQKSFLVQMTRIGCLGSVVLAPAFTATMAMAQADPGVDPGQQSSAVTPAPDSTPTATPTTGSDAALAGAVSTSDVSALASVTAATQTVDPGQAHAALNNLAGQALVDMSGQLNLMSTLDSIQANINQAMNITIGGTLGTDGAVSGGNSYTVHPGQLLSPAEFTALSQVQLTGVQSLLVNDLGQAAGGFATFTPDTVHSITSLVVPQNVNLNLVGFNSNNPFNIINSGDSSQILGAVNLFDTTAGATGHLNVTSSLTLGSGSLLSGYLPDNGLFSSFFPLSSLILNIGGDLLNGGSILSPGLLSVTTGGNIDNLAGASMQGANLALSA
ncbi:MAG TPA: hypothetical protein PKE54_23590, partial [Candidatus Obscuribacter sp.]|nr:hypothetical protein [Candidatus Obscuribacter sp.]